MTPRSNDTTKHGAATLYDSIRDVSNFKNNYAPYPIVLSTSRNAGQSQILLTNPICASGNLFRVAMLRMIVRRREQPA